MLVPLVAAPMSKVIGAPLPLVQGVSGTLGRANSARNPRRTAATASALMIGIAVVALSIVVGIALGLVAGYFRGTLEIAIMRLMDIILTLPSLLLAIVIVAILGPGIMNAMLAVAVVVLPHYVRITRAAARAGADKDAVAARVREARSVLRIWFCLDTLEYLRRGGRIGKAQAWLGGTLKIKPILSLEYEIVPVERVRTAGRAFERMVRYAEELHDGGSDAWVVQHIQAPEQAQRLIDRCREIFDSEPVFTSEVGPVIGTYTGPGLIGVGALPRTLLA